jgi:hypothetical protein
LKATCVLFVSSSIETHILLKNEHSFTKERSQGLRGIHIQREGIISHRPVKSDTGMNSFMSTLRQLGSAGNGALRDAFGWAESR